ncbi:ubiquinone/menaquinone biosynthesis C-methylase UbiE [Salinibacter ruber]|uniref:class I SAM-dependent methyltransferase n=1 Tax=Salinibacter ruber TaxID=146919 RepID=UPI0021675BBA|nr:ubiquinone/menaquinone biosynthesis C-methylase UbiE [Salinibacter ruber]
MITKEEYYARYPIRDPAHAASRIAGEQIQENAQKYFSGRMLEIGCGDKSKGALVGEYVDEHVGLDLPDSETPHTEIAADVVGSALDMPLDDESFDCVLSTAVLEHLEEPQRALSESYRVLKPGGYALYTMPLFWHLHEEPRDFFRYTKYGLRHLFTTAGYELVHLKALSGFFVTFGAELGYYLRRFARGPATSRIVAGITAVLNKVAPRLDRIEALRDEKFTWMYLVVARKPGQENGGEEE